VDAAAALAALPRAGLAGATPLEPMERLSAGLGVQVWAGDRGAIVGIDVAAMRPDLTEVADDLARRAAALVGLDLPDPGADVRGGFVGDGYGAWTPQAADALERFARTEAVVLDPVYSGKGAAGLLAMALEADAGRAAAAPPAVLVHGRLARPLRPGHAGALGQIRGHCSTPPTAH
jgi:1-aminocyclopropane-1-carboxylate deaminase/D-cysteine desulfhydrase-like pyridoxal-dependent ACC family enzyme